MPDAIEQNVKKLPPFASTPDDLRSLGLWIGDLVQAAQDAKGGLPEIWEEIGRNTRDEMPDDEETMGEGEAVCHIPILSPRLDTLACDVNTIILNQDPIMLCENMGDDASADVLERLIHRMWTDGGIGPVTRVGTLEAGITNRFMYRVSFELNMEGILSEGDDKIELRPTGLVRFAGIKIEGVQAVDFVIGPSTIDGIQSGSIVGHRFWQTVASIKEKQGLGQYLPVPEGETDMLGGDNPSQTEHARAYYNAMVSPSSLSGRPETDMVECYETFVRKAPGEGKRARYYRIVHAQKAQIVLDVEEWPYTRPPYFMSSFVPDLIGFWGGRIVGRKLIPIQTEYDRVHARTYNGSMMASAPPVFDDSPESKEDYIQYEPGQIIHREMGSAPPWSPSISFNGEALENLADRLERSADSTIQISTNALGQEEAKDTTATQTQAIQQGASTRLSEYVANYVESWPQMAAFTCELLYSNYSLWKPFTTDIDILRESLIAPKRWVVSGRDPASSPASRRASLGQIMVLAQNPATEIDAYEVAKAALRYSGIPGAGKFQREKPIANPATAPGATPGIASPPDPGAGPTPPLALSPAGPVPPANHAFAAGAVEPSHDLAGPGANQADLRAAG